jgi:hypothetical protein
MAGTQVTEYEQYWLHEVNSLHSEYKGIVAKYPDAAPVMEKVHKVLCDIVRIASYTPANVGRGEEWKSIVESAEQDRRQLCDSLKVKLLFSALYGTYTVTLSNLKSVLQTSANQRQKTATKETPKASDDGFREQRRRKRNSSSNADTDNQRKDKNKAENTAVWKTVQSVKKVPTTRNNFAPLRTPQMEAEENEPPTEEQQTSPAVSGRPPLIVLTSAINLIQLQSNLKSIVKGNFEFRSTRNGTRVVTRQMANYSAIREYFDTKNLHYFTFYPKSQIKCRH